LAGVLDAGGNVLFMLAKQLTRLDIAVVLSSILPGLYCVVGSLVAKRKSVYKAMDWSCCLPKRGYFDLNLINVS
jgi:hypothetical protein